MTLETLQTVLRRRNEIQLRRGVDSSAAIALVYEDHPPTAPTEDRSILADRVAYRLAERVFPDNMDNLPLNLRSCFAAYRGILTRIEGGCPAEGKQADIMRFWALNAFGRIMKANASHDKKLDRETAAPANTEKPQRKVLNPEEIQRRIEQVRRQKAPLTSMEAAEIDLKARGLLL